MHSSVRNLMIVALVVAVLTGSAMPGLAQATSQEVNIERIKSRAAAGSADAQYILGDLYINGLGVPADRQKGARWLRKSAEQGYAPAQYMLGYLWSYGGGGILPNDKPQDIKPEIWFRKDTLGNNSHIGSKHCMSEP